jgi:hypothetical protein
LKQQKPKPAPKSARERLAEELERRDRAKREA